MTISRGIHIKNFSRTSHTNSKHYTRYKNIDVRKTITRNLGSRTASINGIIDVKIKASSFEYIRLLEYRHKPIQSDEDSKEIVVRS